jgi:hypothetical protein
MLGGLGQAACIGLTVDAAVRHPTMLPELLLAELRDLESGAGLAPRPVLSTTVVTAREGAPRNAA